MALNRLKERRAFLYVQRAQFFLFHAWELHGVGGIERDFFSLLRLLQGFMENAVNILYRFRRKPAVRQVIVKALYIMRGEFFPRNRVEGGLDVIFDCGGVYGGGGGFDAAQRRWPQDCFAP